LVALPVLMATTGNVIAVQLRAPVALPARPRRAPVFTAAIVIATGLVLAMVVGLQISPVRLLVIASVIAGVATPIGLIAMMLVSQDRRIMHARTIGGRLRAAGWAVTLVITLFSGLALAQQLTG
jgi:Mn2+/Fe2+ NRAMP family transporter